MDDRHKNRRRLLHRRVLERDVRWGGRGGRLTREKSFGEDCEEPRQPERSAHAAKSYEPDVADRAVACRLLGGLRHQSSGGGEVRGEPDGLGLGLGLAFDCVPPPVGLDVDRTTGGEA